MMEINRIQTSAEISAVQKINISEQPEKTANSANKILSLNDVDTESEIIKKESAKTNTKNEYGVNQTDQEHFEQDVTNSKGTTYVVMGNLPACGTCVKLENKIAERLDEIEEKAQIYNIQWKDKTQNNSVFCKHILDEIGKNPCSFPIVVKFVDGKPTEVISSGEYVGNKKVTLDSIVQDMLDKAEGTPSKPAKNTEDCPECNVGTDSSSEAKKENSEQKALKQKLETLKENLNISKNLVQSITSDSLENAIESASSIDELKMAITTYSTGLDFNTQINLTSVTNSLTSDSDLDAAKEKILELL